MSRISELENLCKPRSAKSLTREVQNATEIGGLIQSGKLRLTEAKNNTLSLESRFDLFYNTYHAFSLAAQRKARYQPVNRYIVF